MSDGCGGKFMVTIVSDKFQGKKLLEKHRLVNTCLEEEIKMIHAFSQKTYTPEQWEKQQNKWEIVKYSFFIVHTYLIKLISRNYFQGK